MVINELGITLSLLKRSVPTLVVDLKLASDGCAGSPGQNYGVHGGPIDEEGNGVGIPLHTFCNQKYYSKEGDAVEDGSGTNNPGGAAGRWRRCPGPLSGVQRKLQQWSHRRP